MTHRTSAMVVLSGGQDSTTCLYWAKSRFDDVHAVTFDYGQRHRAEIDAAITIARRADVLSHEVVYLREGILAGKSPLISNTHLEQYEDHHSLPGGLEKTFVPCRNQLFLTIAANRALARNIHTLVTGVCQEDYGGYPDCRREFIDHVENALTSGTFADGEAQFRILTPLMFLTKAASVQLALQYPGCYSALAWSHTSYDGAYPPVGRDHATLLRAKGFEEAGVPDPLILRAHKDGLMELPLTENYKDAAKWIRLI